MTPNFKELREELEEVFRYEERYRETGYIHPDVEDWEEAVWRNRFAILAALELASSDRPREIAERGQWVKCEERMPEAEEDVMIWGPEFHDIGHLSVSEETRFFVYDGYDFKEVQTDITHWMPLPLPPEEK